MDGSQQQRPSWIELAAMLAVNLAAVLAAWHQLPEQERYWMRLTITGKLRAMAAGLAAREGRAGMGDELAGRDPRPRYNVALGLSRARDGLARALEAMRP